MNAEQCSRRKKTYTSTAFSIKSFMQLTASEQRSVQGMGMRDLHVSHGNPVAVFASVTVLLLINTHFYGNIVHRPLNKDYRHYVRQAQSASRLNLRGSLLSSRLTERRHKLCNYCVHYFLSVQALSEPCIGLYRAMKPSSAMMLSVATQRYCQQQSACAKYSIPTQCRVSRLHGLQDGALPATLIGIHPPTRLCNGRRLFKIKISLFVRHTCTQIVCLLATFRKSY